jgi:ferredoxin
VAIEVSIDPDLCIGSAECGRILPDAFEIDELAGVSIPLPAALTHSVEDLAAAARACPTNAIRVAEDGRVIVASAG